MPIIEGTGIQIETGKDDRAARIREFDESRARMLGELIGRAAARRQLARDDIYTAEQIRDMGHEGKATAAMKERLDSLIARARTKARE